MIKITEVAFIAYPVSDINRARDFYENLLGLPPGEFNHELEGMPVADHIESPVCCFALVADPDGNGITIHKRKTRLA
jgi:catechol 2,3-dioxygenase-like lactoylglutathione lyase family enzyme